MSARRRIAIIIIFLILTVVAAVGIDRWVRSVAPPPTIDSLPANDELSQLPSREGEAAPAPLASRAIRGQVLRSTGEPAPGARVLLQGVGDFPPVEVVVDAGGSFRFDDLDLGLYAVEASQEGYGPAQLIGVVPGGAPLRLVLVSGKDLRGQLIRRGQVLNAGVVHVGGAGIFPTRSQRFSGASEYRVSGLRPGRLEGIATAPGLSSGFIEGISIDSEGAAQHDFQMLVAPTMNLRFTDRGTGEVIDSGVVTISSRPLHVLSLTTQIFFGEATIDFLPPGEYWMRVRAPGYLPLERRFWVTQGGGSVDITLHQGARIQGKVVDQAGNPLSGVSLRAILDTESGAKFDMKVGIFEVFHGLARPDGTTFWWPTSSYTTNREGMFDVGGLPSGRAIIMANKEGFATGMSPQITIQHDQTYEDLRIVLERGRALRGRVENARGRAIAGAVVTAVPKSIPAWVSGRSLVTDGTGNFVFQGLPSQVRLTVRHPRFGVHQEELEISSSGLDNHVVQLSGDDTISYAGRILGSVAGDTLGAKIWFLRRDNNIPVCFAYADEKGAFDAQQCSAVAERVVVFKAGFAPLLGDAPKIGEEREFVLRKGGELDIVSQGLPMTVEVVPDFHLPDEAWAFEAIPIERWKRHNVKLLAPGAYHVICQAEGYAPARIRVDVRNGERAEAVCPFPTRVATQEVAVLDPQNAPVADAVVWIEGLSSTPIRLQTDARGRIVLDGSPERWVHLDASHERWGAGSISFQLPKEPIEARRLPLQTPIGGTDTASTIRKLQSWGLRVILDGRSLIVEDVQRGTPADNVGLRRGDKLLWIRDESNTRLSVGVRRRSDIVTHVMVQVEP